MEWTDDGVIIFSQKQGDSSLIVRCFTRNHGRHAGLVRGGAGKRHRGITQIGNEVQLTWKGRVSSQLGHYSVELKNPRLAAVMEDSLGLNALSSALTLLEISLPEREPHPALYEATLVMMDNLETADENAWLPVYVKWELGLLSELGYGLDMHKCAASGATENLIYISPKSGRAVSEEAGKPYHDKLLALPLFLKPMPGGIIEMPSAGDIQAGLTLTGYFLDKCLRRHHHTTLCPARDRFVTRLNRKWAGDAKKHII